MNIMRLPSASMTRYAVSPAAIRAGVRRIPTRRWCAVRIRSRVGLSSVAHSSVRSARVAHAASAVTSPRSVIPLGAGTDRV
jgi:hypothetical protein